MLKKIIISIAILALFTQIYGQKGYRDALWGSSKDAVKKTVSDYYANNNIELDNSLIYKGQFQGNSASYKYIFGKDSLVMVGITSILPYNLLEQDMFKKNFNKSEDTVEELLNRLKAKYGNAELEELTGTNLFVQWKVDGSIIELFVERSARYKILLTYSWQEYFERSTQLKNQNYNDEL